MKKNTKFALKLADKSILISSKWREKTKLNTTNSKLLFIATLFSSWQTTSRLIVYQSIFSLYSISSWKRKCVTIKITITILAIVMYHVDRLLLLNTNLWAYIYWYVNRLHFMYERLSTDLLPYNDLCARIYLVTTTPIDWRIE